MEGEIKSETLKCFIALRLSLVKSLKERKKKEILLFLCSNCVRECRKQTARSTQPANPRQVNGITETGAH